MRFLHTPTRTFCLDNAIDSALDVLRQGRLFHTRKGKLLRTPEGKLTCTMWIMELFGGIAGHLEEEMRSVLMGSSIPTLEERLTKLDTLAYNIEKLEHLDESTVDLATAKQLRHSVHRGLVHFFREARDDFYSIHRITRAVTCGKVAEASPECMCP